MSVSTRAWLNPTSASKSYGTTKSFVDGSAAGDGRAGGGALSNASRPLLGPGGRGGSNVRLYRSSAGSMVLHDASGSGITDRCTGFRTMPPQMRGSADTVPSTSTRWPSHGGVTGEVTSD